MLSRLLRRPRPSRAAPPAVPDGVRIYAIGDVHGCVAELEALLALIDADADARGPVERTSLVFLGDLVDRGPASRSVVATAMAIAGERSGCRFIRGNHEEVFLAALAGDREALRLFSRIGGRETALSYGATAEQYERMDYDELAGWLAENVPAEHAAFLDRFEDMVIEGDYAFVHAGVRPGIALDAQRGTDLRWIRNPFLTHTGGFEKTVVHGHSISAGIDRGPDRIGIDTGAFAGGPLTALGLEGRSQWEIATVSTKSDI